MRLESGLTQKQEKFIEAFIETGSSVKAARQAYPNLQAESTVRSVASENLQKPSIREVILRKLSEKSSLDVAFEQTHDALTAEDQDGNKDYRVRLTAANMVYRLAGVYASDQPQQTGPVTNVQVNIFQSEPAVVLSWAAEHGRLPSPTERAELLALPGSDALQEP